MSPEPMKETCPWCGTRAGPWPDLTLSFLPLKKSQYLAHLDCAIVAQRKGRWPDRSKRTGEAWEPDLRVKLQAIIRQKAQEAR